MKLKIIAIFIIALIVSVAAYSKNNLFFYAKMNGFWLEDGMDFKITEKGENRIKAENGGEILKIRIFKDFEKEEFEKYAREQEALLKGIFEPQLPPYPEFLTKETGCDKKYKPIKKQNSYGDYKILYAGERFGYGVCVDDLIRYQASIGYFYCPEGKMAVQLEYFIPQDENRGKLINLNNSFKCK